MNSNDYVHLVAGLMVTISALLGFFINKYWLLLSLFVGLNLFQFSLTKFCPLKTILEKFGAKKS